MRPVHFVSLSPVASDDGRPAVRGHRRRLKRHMPPDRQHEGDRAQVDEYRQPIGVGLAQFEDDCAGVGECVGRGQPSDTGVGVCRPVVQPVLVEAMAQLECEPDCHAVE